MTQNKGRGEVKVNTKGKGEGTAGRGIRGRLFLRKKGKAGQGSKTIRSKKGLGRKKKKKRHAVKGRQFFPKKGERRGRGTTRSYLGRVLVGRKGNLETGAKVPAERLSKAGGGEENAAIKRNSLLHYRKDGSCKGDRGNPKDLQERQCAITKKKFS